MSQRRKRESVRGRLIVFIMLGVAAVFALIFARTRYMARNLPHDVMQEKRLRILTYSNFFGGGGPGPRLLGEFKQICDCEMDTISAGDAGLILEHLKLTQKQNPVDVVIGIDQMAVVQARGLAWKKVDVDDKNFPPLVRQTRTDLKLEDAFVPFDWAPMSFVYRDSLKNPPKVFNDLLKPEFKGKFALQDPRSSSAGLQFYQWVRAVKGPQATDFLRRFKENVGSVSPSWSFAYGLFNKKKADFVFSYVTSLAFHWGIEKDRSIKILSFPEGHPVQIEYAAIPDDCRQCELAQKFMKFLVEAKAQEILMNMNFMLPVNSSVIGSSVFSELPPMKVIAVPTDKDLSAWNEAFK